MENWCYHAVLRGLDACVKVFGKYYCDVLLSQKCFLHVATVDTFILQQDNAPAHRTHETIQLLQRDDTRSLSLLICGRQTTQIEPGKLQTSEHHAEACMRLATRAWQTVTDCHCRPKQTVAEAEQYCRHSRWRWDEVTASFLCSSAWATFRTFTAALKTVVWENSHLGLRRLNVFIDVRLTKWVV